MLCVARKFIDMFPDSPSLRAASRHRSRSGLGITNSFDYSDPDPGSNSVPETPTRPHREINFDANTAGSTPINSETNTPRKFDIISFLQWANQFGEIISLQVRQTMMNIKCLIVSI
jgi:hypothetical protein